MKQAKPLVTYWILTCYITPSHYTNLGFNLLHNTLPLQGDAGKP